MALVLTIAGTPKAIKRDTINISKTANGRATASFSVDSTDGSYRPAMDAQVVFTLDSDVIFTGLAQRPEEVGIMGTGLHPGITTTVNAVDYNAYAERRLVNGVMPAGTLKTHLQIVADYLNTFGVTLNPAQITGPALPELIHEYLEATEVLNEIITLASEAGGVPLFWNIDDNKVLTAAPTTTTAAPFNIVTVGATTPDVVGDITVISDRTHYANVVIVLVPTLVETGRTETFTGDGTTTTFTLNYTMEVATWPGYVTHAGNNETLGLAGEGATWTYDPPTNTITRTSAPAAAAPISITFNGSLTTFGLASDAAEILAVGYWERVLRVQSVPNAAAAQSMAEAELAKRLAVLQTVSYPTMRPGLEPGQLQTITVPRRNVNAAGLITDVNIRDVGGKYLMYDVTVTIDPSQTNIGKGWRDVYKQWSADTSGTAHTLTTGAPPVGTSGAAPPLLSVQINRNGALGGSAGFLVSNAGDSAILGDGCSITAANPTGCLVVGINGTIEDP